MWLMPVNRERYSAFWILGWVRPELIQRILYAQEER